MMNEPATSNANELPEWQQLEVLHLLALSCNQQYRGFPKGCCAAVAAKVEELLEMPRKSGLFIDDHGLGHPHDWNIDPRSSRVVDLTACQFEPTFREVYFADAADNTRYLEGVGVGF